MAQSDTGFSDLMYDLVSVQYHALQGGETYGKYVQDAEQAGKDDIASFFREVQQQDAQRAQRCHELLGQLSGMSSSS